MNPKIHIENGAKPFLINEYLSLIDREDFESVEDVQEHARERGYEFGDAGKTNIASTLKRLGLLRESDATKMTDTGRNLAEILKFDEKLFYNLLHYIYISSFEKKPSGKTLISWSYAEITRFLYEEAPIENLSSKNSELLEHISLNSRDKAGEKGFPYQEINAPAFSKKSFNGYKNYISVLEPSVLEGKKFSLREYAPVQLMLLAIDYLYQSRETVNYGDPIELDDKVKRDLGIVSLVKPERLDKMLENAEKNYDEVSMISGYNLKIKLNSEVTLNKFS